MTDDITRRATSARPVRLVPMANTDGGYDPRSTYCELFWLPLLGPASVLLLRRTAFLFDAHPNTHDWNERTPMPEQLDLNRLRRHAPTTLVCLPENADPAQRTSDVVAVTNLTGDVLRLIRARLDEVPDRRGSLPAPLGDHDTLAAVARLEAAIGDAYRTIPPRPVTPGNTELAPLRWARLERADVAALGRTGRAFGTALLPPADELVAGLLQDLLPGRQDPQDLVADIARLHGLVELDWDDDVALLAAQLSPADHPRKVVLDHAALDAYRRVTDRIVAIWHVGDPLASWLYRGD